MKDVPLHNDTQNYVPVHATDTIKRIQHPHPAEEYLSGPVEYRLEERPPSMLATHAIDETSQFDPTFDEMYEMDSFFTGSSAESINGSLTEDSVVAAVLASAHKAAGKKERRIAKMESIVIEDEKRRGKWSVHKESNAPKVRHMRSDLLEDGSIFSGGNAEVSAEGSQISISVSLPQTQSTSNHVTGAEPDDVKPSFEKLHRVLSMDDLSADELYSQNSRNITCGEIIGSINEVVSPRAPPITTVRGDSRADQPLTMELATSPNLTRTVDDDKEDVRIEESFMTANALSERLCSYPQTWMLPLMKRIFS